MSQADFLPPIKTFSYNWAEWKGLIEDIYVDFVDTFISNTVSFQGMRVEIRSLKDDNKEQDFWHLVTRDIERAGEREAEVQRAVRCHWAACLISNYQDPAVSYFVTRDDRGRLKHHFWHQPEDYVVILVERSNRLFIVTAFVVDQHHKRKAFQRYLTEWIASGGRKP
jgi:hypothetical protein